MQEGEAKNDTQVARDKTAFSSLSCKGEIEVSSKNEQHGVFTVALCISPFKNLEGTAPETLSKSSLGKILLRKAHGGTRN